MSHVRVYAAALALLLALVAAEVLARFVDRLSIARAPAASLIAGTSSRDRADDPYLRNIPLAPGVDPAWYRHDPPPQSPLPVSDVVARRFKRYEGMDQTVAFFAWNRLYLHERLCSPDSAPFFAGYDDFYVFDPPAGTSQPPYRHLPYAQVPGWFPTNRFGWRGPDLELNKPLQTIRIAFLGSSKTIDPYGEPFSHIELLGEWLNLWTRARGFPYRVEVINAARTGISETSIAGILTEEVLPLEPDLVIDDGGNDFAPTLLLPISQRGTGRPPKATEAEPPWRTDSYFALSRRIHATITRLRHRDGTEPRKPAHTLQWPPDVDEHAPDVTRSEQPMQLQTLLQSYDRMRVALQTDGGQLGLPSWVVMARDGLSLRFPDDLTLYNALNWTYFPLTYAEIRRAADFYNRLFRAYADRHGLPFFDLAAGFPLDPALFGDILHKTPAGRRLESWIYLQHIAAWIEAQIAQGKLPRPMQHPRSSHPALSSTGYPLVPRAEVQKQCS